MKTINQLDDLQTSELERIRATLRERFGIGEKGNIVEIAFGIAEKKGDLDRNRTNSICFYVKRKRTPRAKVDRIPAEIETRIRRGSKYLLVCLSTDVIQIGSKQIKPSGRPIRHQEDTGPATTGCVVAWKLPGQHRLTWGLISVGHVLTRVAEVPENEQRVLIMSATSPPHRFRGTLVARSLRDDGNQIDACVVRVSRASLVRAAFIPSNVSTVGKRIRTVDQLRSDRGKAGYTFPIRTRIPFVVARFLPVSAMVPALGLQKNVIETNSRTGAFRPGRSGSLWVVQRQVACIQHGSLTPRFARGWGQSLESIIDWGAEEIASLNGVSQSQVDMRVIRIV